MAQQANIALTSTAIDGVLKRYFVLKTTQNQINKAKPAIYRDMKSGDTKGGGDYCSFTQILNDVWTASPDFDEAQSLASTASGTIGLKFNMPWQEIVAPIRVSAKARSLASTDQTAWVKILSQAVMGAMRSAHYCLAIFALGTGWGELAESGITYGGSGAAFTVSNGAQNKFIENMPLVFADSIHADALRSGTAIKVLAVDYSTGTITCATALTVPGALTGDYVFLSGARQNSATPSRLCGVGLRTWLPEVRPVVDATITTVEGTARGSNSRAYGQAVDGSSMDDTDALIELAMACRVVGNATSLKGYVSSKRWVAIAKAASSDRRFTTSSEGDQGFRKLTISASEIEVVLHEDIILEDDVGYVLPPDGFEMKAAGGECPRIDSEGGGQWLRVSNANGTEARVYGVYAFIFDNIAAGGVVKFAALA